MKTKYHNHDDVMYSELIGDIRMALDDVMGTADSYLVANATFHIAKRRAKENRPNAMHWQKIADALAPVISD